MKDRIIAYALIGVALLVAGSALRPKPLAGDFRDEFDLAGFGRLPVLDAGRLKPLDTIARNSLVSYGGRQSALDDSGHRIPPLQWLADVLFDQQTASTHRVFRVANPDLLGLLGSGGDDVVYFSYYDLVPYLTEIDRQAGLAPEEIALRTPYQKAVVRLRRILIQYQGLEAAMVPPVQREAKVTDLLSRYQRVLPFGRDLVHSRHSDSVLPSSEAAEFMRLVSIFQFMADSSSFLSLPADAGPQRWREAIWTNVGTSLLEMIHGGREDPLIRSYAQLADGWRTGDAVAFNSALAAIQMHLEPRLRDSSTRTGLEFFFNRVEPFYFSLQLYVLAFLATCLLWLRWSRPLHHAIFAILCLALVSHTFGLAVRVYLSGYAPVTNLYSSAVFVGWGAVLISLPLERLYRDGLAGAAAALTGFLTLIIAHNLAISGGVDTMEMMRAVLDSNFWLSTHVITITIGYSATFFAAALGIFFILRGVFTRSLDSAGARSIEHMVYGVICFALLFNFAGTVLGGIWADQSWGRFWGWDPKENGALMIIIWCALMLHARRIGIVGPRGFMQLAVGGGIITSWSWFGTNMLGVGLHSYGFMDKAFLWMITFWISQLAIIAVAAVPSARWRSQVLPPEYPPDQNGMTSGTLPWPATIGRKPSEP